MMLDGMRALRRRVVITGCGVVSPVGHSVGEFWTALSEGRSGVAPITAFDTTGLDVRIAAEVKDFDPSEFMPRPVARRLDSFAQYALAAGVQAAEQAGLAIPDAESGRAAVVVGTGYAAHKMIMNTAKTLAEKGPRALSPYFAVTTGPDAGSVAIGLTYGVRGPSGGRSTACATGTTCIGEAARLIQCGDVDVAFAGASDDVITYADMVTTARTGALSSRNDDPAAASRPFDLDRDGFVMGAGAGVVVLEEAGRAMARGVEILAEVIGFGAACDAYHLTATHPEGRGAKGALREALADAGIEPDEIDYVNAHGTSTKANDSVEIAVLREVLGKTATAIPVSSIKSMTGHPIGAAGALEAIATVQTLRTGIVPPTVNCARPEDPEFNFVPGRAQHWPTRIAVSNSFGFGGHCAVLVLRQWDEGQWDEGQRVERGNA